MAVITISRQVAALGDEVAGELAKRLGYKFITRKEIEKRIVELGFPENKMPKFDERKPGFFASLTKDRDEYLNYAQYAILEAAEQKNVVIIGRGAFADANRAGFHSSFYNVDISDPVNYHLVLNTGLLTLDLAASTIASLVEQKVTIKEEEEGNKMIEELLKAQTVVNKLSMERKLNIEFMHATIQGNTVVLHGVSDSPAVVEQALQIIREEMPGYDAKSAVSIIHDFKTFQ